MLVLQSFAEPRLISRVMVLAERQAGKLVLDFNLSGDLGSLEIPTVKAVPERMDNLWENTCFECFFAPAGKNEYWEVNFAPSGDWNYYSFVDYRQGMRTESVVESLSVHCGGAGDVLTVSTVVPLPSSIAAADIEVGLCAVVKSKSGEVGYWALTHPAGQPDFHDRRSFVVTL